MACQNKDVGGNRQAGGKDGCLYPDYILSRQKQEQGGHHGRMQQQACRADAGNLGNGFCQWLSVNRCTKRKQRHRRGGTCQHGDDGVDRAGQGQPGCGKGQPCHDRDQQRIFYQCQHRAPQRCDQPAGPANNKRCGQHQQNDRVGKQHQRQWHRRRITKGHDGQRHTHITIIGIGSVQPENTAFKAGETKGRSCQQRRDNEQGNGRQFIPPEKAPVQNIFRCPRGNIHKHHRWQRHEEREFGQVQRAILTDETDRAGKHAKKDQREKGDGQGKDIRHRRYFVSLVRWSVRPPPADH